MTAPSKPAPTRADYEKEISELRAALVKSEDAQKELSQMNDHLTGENGGLRDEAEAARAELAELSQLMAQTAPAEAGFSMNWHMIHDKVGDIGFTMRGARSGDWLMTWSDAEQFINHLLEKKWRFNVPQPAPPPATNKAVEILKQAGNVEAAATVQAEAERVPDPPEGKAWQTITVQRVVVKPQPGDLVDIEFWQPARRYAEIRCAKWKNERAAGLLKHVTSHDVTKPADLALPCIVYYTEGKEYVKTNGEKGHYQDVGHVRPMSA